MAHMYIHHTSITIHLFFLHIFHSPGQAGCPPLPLSVTVMPPIKPPYGPRSLLSMHCLVHPLYQYGSPQSTRTISWSNITDLGFLCHVSPVMPLYGISPYHTVRIPYVHILNRSYGVTVCQIIAALKDKADTNCCEDVFIFL